MTKDLGRIPAGRLESLLEVGGLLTSTLELDAILDVLVTRAGELLQCEAISLLLLDEAGTSLVFAVAKGAKGEELREQRLPVDTGVAGWVAREGKPVLIGDAHKDSRFYSGYDEESGFDTRSLLAVPLKVKDRLIGVLEAINARRASGFDESDMALIMAFAHFAAIAIENARLYGVANQEREELRVQVSKRYQIVGESPALTRVIDLAKAVADSKATVLLLGESGTGKEIFARAITQWSPRAGRPFVAVNCTTLSQELLASELFGHEKGSFTGATRQKIGKVELAQRGTLFLDEIGEMPQELQIKLLRLLQEHEIERVGGNRPIAVDIRVIAATNLDLEKQVREGKFREDLFYRLNVVPIILPPLRERIADLDLLVAFFLERYAKESRKNLKSLTSAAMDAMRAHHWPGNVRELENVIQRGIVLSRGPQIEKSDLPPDLAAALSSAPEARDGVVMNEDLKEAKRRARDQAAAEVERRFLEQILTASKGNVTQAAAAAGMNRTLLQQLLKKYNIDRSRFARE
ncbi:MAG: sigma 54-interacting transcriptional regulator [Deltaproteobacteria bacterium]|nr:sigma 54-interacting transcriptional regulator [Deltaproteobacteria bacterium]